MSMQLKQTRDSSVIAINLIILLLGMLLLTQFYSFLFRGVFTPSGWLAYLDTLGQYAPKHAFRHVLIAILKNTSSWSPLLFAVGLLSSAIACITLYARFYIGLFLCICFCFAWAFCWDFPDIWPFELLFPAIFALFAGMGCSKLSLKSQSLCSQLGFSFGVSVIAISVLSLLLYYVTFNAYDIVYLSSHVAIFSALSFFIIGLGAYHTSRKQPEMDTHGLANKYLDYMTLAIGAMLVMQVYENHFSGLFKSDEFKNSLLYYSVASSISWIHFFLKLSADYSKWILPFYIVFECFLAINLCLLLFRGPTLLMTSGLLSVLAFAELGVSQTWPPTPHNLTWEWELLLVSLVSLIIGIQRVIPLCSQFSLKKLVLGDPLGHYGTIPFLMAIASSIVSGILLYFTGELTHASQGTSLYSGISFGILLFILLVTNGFRNLKKTGKVLDQ